MAIFVRLLGFGFCLGFLSGFSLVTYEVSFLSDAFVEMKFILIHAWFYEDMLISEIRAEIYVRSLKCVQI